MALLRCTGSGAEMARGGAPPCARAAGADIVADAGYSGRGRRPVAATPSARLFSKHHSRIHAFFAKKYIADVNVRALLLHLL